MKTTIISLLIGCCVLIGAAPLHAALDWRIEWSDASSPQTARVYIFNPEATTQTFSLEIGDMAKIADGEDAPLLIVGQDVSLALSPSERKIFDIIVYQDIDPAHLYAIAGGTTYHLSKASYQALSQRYDLGGAGRQYPVSIMKIEPTERAGATQNARYIYRSGRGYWTIALTDHNQVAEHIIRTGNNLNAQHVNIQQAILYYTHGNTQLSTEAVKIWQTAFPELISAVATPTSLPDCLSFITYSASNPSQYASQRKISIGDVLGSSDASLSRVVAAEEVTYTVPANAQASKYTVKVFQMSLRGQSSAQSEYVSIIKHDAKIENAIRIGTAENYRPCAIQDVIYYLNREVSSLTTGATLWQRLNGKTGQTNTGQRTCFGGRVNTNASARYSSFGQLFLVLAVVVPVSVFFRRKDGK